MAVDKRFWTGVIAVVTVAVAGASALPALLLAPATPETPPPVLAAVAAEPAAPTTPEPVRSDATERRTPATARAEPPPQAESAPAVEPAPVTPIAAAPPQAAPTAQPETAAPPIAAAPPEAASVQSFPPVQPVGVEVAAKDAPAAAPIPDTSRPVSATIKPTRSAREAHASRGAKQKRIRPASYPIREFLAWRR